jgi:hypothetical protein
MTNYIKYTLSQFKKIELKEMDAVRLMNRKECKYIINSRTLISILNKLHQDYSILEINQQRVMPYESLYFDYPDLDLYRTHQNGKLNRYKIRKRTYKTTGQKFLELKFKNNKKRTIKKRMEITKETQRTDIKDFLSENFPHSIQGMKEVMKIDYDRITLVGKSLNERITIDLNLRYSSKNKKTAYENLAIIELKHEGNLKTSTIESVLKEKGIKPMSMSKYCLGISQHYEQVKTNSINVKIRQINKILKLGNPSNRDTITSNKAS